MLTLNSVAHIFHTIGLRELAVLMGKAQSVGGLRTMLWQGAQNR